jgi:hypothetical protein
MIKMQKDAATNVLGFHLVETAGHCEQEQPERASELLVDFLKRQTT